MIEYIEPEYIDRDLFREHIDSIYPFTKVGQSNPEYDYAKSVFLQELLKFPTTDAVHVVRCKDCARSFMFRNGTRGCYEHTEGIHCNPIHVSNDNFCSWGVRKTEDYIERVY